MNEIIFEINLSFPKELANATEKITSVLLLYSEHRLT
jgi:hypothetical protein